MTLVLTITVNTIIFELLRPNKSPSKYTLIHDDTIEVETTSLKQNQISRFKTMHTVIFTFADLLNNFKPTLIIGYGIKRNGFKLIRQALVNKGLEQSFREIKHIKLLTSSEEFGEEMWYLSDTYDCTVVDVFSLLQKKQLSLRSYKLNNVLHDLQLSNIVQLYTYLSSM